VTITGATEPLKINDIAAHSYRIADEIVPVLGRAAAAMPRHAVAHIKNPQLNGDASEQAGINRREPQRQAPAGRAPDGAIVTRLGDAIAMDVTP
jgi:hypothetical protein